MKNAISPCTVSYIDSTVQRGFKPQDALESYSPYPPQAGCGLWGWSSTQRQEDADPLVLTQEEAGLAEVGDDHGQEALWGESMTLRGTELE